jgi:hypothetical protein
MILPRPRAIIRGGHRPRDQERTGEVRVDHRPPLFLGHANQRRTLVNAGVIHQEYRSHHTLLQRG